MVRKGNMLRLRIGIGVANITLGKITIFTSRKAKTSTCNWLDRPTATTCAILATKKAKIANDTLNKKSLLPAYL